MKDWYRKDWFRKDRRNHWSPTPRSKTRIKKVPQLSGIVPFLWIDAYALKTKSFYLKLTQEGPDPLLWAPREIEHVDELKQALITAQMLALPSLEQPFHLFVNVNKGVALGLLTPKYEGQHQPMAFLSKFLDPVT
jgi:hypothetical protein